MTAQIIEHGAPGGKRIQLIDSLPLKAPILLQYFPIYQCNFACNYCTFSIPKQDRGFISGKSQLHIVYFKKSLLDSKDFLQDVKVVRFVGMGEPFLHKKIVDMFEYTRKIIPNSRIEVITNGSLLNKELSHRIARSGLNRMIISIQGLSTQDYRKTGHPPQKFNFEEFLSEIKFLHDNSDVHIHAKIIDIGLGSNTKEKFYEIFSDKCSSMGIEKANPLFPGVELNNELVASSTQFNEQVKNMDICPQPFFTMQVNPDGYVVPCYSVDYPMMFGNIKRKSLEQIWNSTTFKIFRKKMVTEGRSCMRVCKNCTIAECRYNKEDDLDAHKKHLLDIYS